MTINITIKDNIRKFLEIRGLKQADLARKAELPISSIQNIYSDVTKDPKITMLLAITRALNISIYDLVGYGNIAAEHKEFYKNIILEVEQKAATEHITLTESKKKMIVNELYQFAKQKAGDNEKALLNIDSTYLEMLLQSSNQP